MRRLAQIARWLFWSCLAWALFIHVAFLVTLRGDFIEDWFNAVRGTPFIVPAIALVMLQFPLMAIGLVAAVIVLLSWVRSAARFGILIGVLLGLWANTEFLAVPYCGAYTSLPAAVMGSILSNGENTGLWYYVPVLVMNIAFWIIVSLPLCMMLPIEQWQRQFQAASARQR